MKKRQAILSLLLAFTLVLGFCSTSFAGADEAGAPGDEQQVQDADAFATDEPAVAPEVSAGAEDTGTADVPDAPATDAAAEDPAAADAGASATGDQPVAGGSEQQDELQLTANDSTADEQADAATKDGEDGENAKPKARMDEKASVSYRAHVQRIGWQTAVKDGKTAGTSGQALRVEALKIEVDSHVKGSISYSSHVQGYGWQGWVADGAVSGTSGQSKRVEAIKVKLTGDLAQKYDVYYRVHVQTFGWLDWAKNGAAAGSAGMAKRVEAVQVKLVKKGGVAPGATVTPFKQALVTYSGHVQRIGWQGTVYDGATAGTSGQSLRVEAIKMNLGSGVSGSISYSSHVQGYGWQGWVADGAVSGTSGQSKRVEAIKVKLTGDAASKYDVYYRVHAQTYGWMGWAKNGAAAGTEGLAKRVEAVQVVLVAKGGAAPGSTAKAYATPAVTYRVYERGIGWSGWAGNGKTAGTSGKSIATEALCVKVADLGVDGSVAYSAHMQRAGWTGESTGGKAVGSAGSNLRMEAVKIHLTGTAARTYDIYYRVHSAGYGWLDWAKNGALAGTEGYSKAVEAIQVKLVRKGGAAPGTTTRPYVAKTTSTPAALKMTLDQMTSWQSGYTNNESMATVKSLLNPGNVKAGSAAYYQFANLDGYSGLTPAQIDSYIASTPSGKSGKLKGTGLAFVAAAKKYNVNECYLVSHAIVESAWGTSALAQQNNFFGMGAYSGGVASTWTAADKGIMGAAQIISEDYVNGSPYQQNTLYNMKWDYLRSNDTMTRGWHQYASDPYWPKTIATVMASCYSSSNVTPSLSYTVPKYKP